MNGNGMICGACDAHLARHKGAYRIVAFDRPRVDVPTCGGSCQAEVQAWDAEQVRLYQAGQTMIGKAHADHR